MGNAANSPCCFQVRGITECAKKQRHLTEESLIEFKRKSIDLCLLAKEMTTLPGKTTLNSKKMDLEIRYLYRSPNRITSNPLLTFILKPFKKFERFIQSRFERRPYINMPSRTFYQETYKQILLSKNRNYYFDQWLLTLRWANFHEQIKTSQGERTLDETQLSNVSADHKANESFQEAVFEFILSDSLHSNTKIIRAMDEVTLFFFSKYDYVTRSSFTGDLEDLHRIRQEMVKDLRYGLIEIIFEFLMFFYQVPINMAFYPEGPSNKRERSASITIVYDFVYMLSHEIVFDPRWNLYPFLLSFLAPLTSEMDKILNNSYEIKEGNKFLQYSSIKNEFTLEGSLSTPYLSSINLLKKISQLRSPKRKLDLMAEIFHDIGKNILRHYKTREGSSKKDMQILFEEFDSDQQLWLFLYVISSSKVESLFLEVFFIEQFIDEIILDCNYFLIVFKSCLEFIVNDTNL